MLQAQLRRGLDALCVSTSEAVDTDPARDPSQHSDDGHRADEGQMRATSQDATSAESGSRKTSPRVHDATPVASHPARRDKFLLALWLRAMGLATAEVRKWTCRGVMRWAVDMQLLVMVGQLFEMRWEGPVCILRRS